MRKSAWSKRSETLRTAAKLGLTAKNVQLCIWGTIRELLRFASNDKKLNYDPYCPQLDRSKIIIDQERLELAEFVQQRNTYLIQTGCSAAC